MEAYNEVKKGENESQQKEDEQKTKTKKITHQTREGKIKQCSIFVAQC